MEYLDFARKVNKLLKEYSFSASDEEVKALFNEIGCDIKKCAISFLNNQVQKTTRKIQGFEQGLMIVNGKNEVETLSRMKGIKQFVYQPKARKLWSVLYINSGVASDFNEAFRLCNRLTKFSVKKASFVFDPVLSERIDKKPLKVVEVRRQLDGKIFYLVEKGGESLLVNGQEKKINDVFREFYIK